MFGQHLTQRHWGCCQEVLALVGILNANPDGQRKEGQQDKIGKLERSPIGERTAHIEVEGHDHRR